jgi:DNA-binding IscR family transcriptional regulator
MLPSKHVTEEIKINSKVLSNIIPKLKRKGFLYFKK